MPAKQSRDRDTKLLLANLEIAVDELHTFESFVYSITVENSAPLDQLKVRVEQFKPSLSRYRDLSVSAIASSISSEDILSFKAFEEIYFNVLSIASSMLENNQMNGSVESLHSMSMRQSNIQNRNSNVKLPRLSIPTFDGNYLDWVSFHETFTALIENNSCLTGVEKFFYLQDALKGSAKDVLNDLTATSNNYQLALNMLKERFNNQKLIIFSHLEAIFEAHKIQKESATDLRKFHDNLVCHLRALDNLQLTEAQFKDAVVSYLVKTKVDARTAAEFSKIKIKQIPSIDEINLFFTQRCELLEEANQGCKNNVPDKVYQSSKHQHAKISGTKHSFVISKNVQPCFLCKEIHMIFSCPEFLRLSVQDRFNKANELKICKNCLKHSNKVKCNSSFKCKHCQKSHNSLLCFSNKSATAKNDDNVPRDEKVAEQSSEQASSTQFSFANTGPSQVLLSTAIVKVKTSRNKWLKARCLLDSASQASFVTSTFYSKLGLKSIPTNTSVVGINNGVSRLEGLIKVTVASLQNKFETELSCLVIPKITENLPLHSFDKTNLFIPNNIKLADTNFNQSSDIDMLIGASHFFRLLCIGQITLGKGQPVLQKTLFGWIVSGNLLLPVSNMQESNSTNVVCSNFVAEQGTAVSNRELHDSLTKFWQVENVQPENKTSLFSREEKFCEEHFQKTTYRDPSGRLIVSIPFNSKIVQLSDSENHALKMFRKLEHRFADNPSLKEEYSKFMHEYERLGHMTKVTNTDPIYKSKISTIDGEVDVSTIPDFFLPHHAVLKLSSLTTKLRVVFNGSCKSLSGVSINDTQLVGPVVQEDLFSILLRFRQHKVALTGDCEKMYRMISIHPSERKFQRIFWRYNPEDPIEIYQLCTITYGTSAASFLATRSLKLLSDLNQEKFPKGSSVIASNFYMDDLLYSGEDIEDVIRVKSEITTILADAGIPIRKFLSNETRVLDNSSELQVSTSLQTIPICERTKAKALGLSWNSVSDFIFYDVNIKNNGPSYTKRSILSMLSQLYDPLGLLAPIIIIGKILIQKLWQLQLSWDEGVPQNINDQWDKFERELAVLITLEIPRCVIPLTSIELELHGFCDSSSVAYGACIYVKCKNSSNQTVRLLCAKSRVAPLHTTTIPRLELCAAVLLAQLIHKTKESLTVDCQNIYFWTDSMVVLNWINSAPNKYKTFVANRIAFIQEATDTTSWHHVRTQHNPADLISRGILPSAIISNDLWWHGPDFLTSNNMPYKTSAVFPHPSKESSDDHECKTTCLITTNTDDEDLKLFQKFSSFSKLKRVFAWIIRFISNARVSVDNRNLSRLLSLDELNNAGKDLIKIAQEEAFPREVQSLKSKLNLKSNSKILCLNPFLDENQLLRVGGRIKYSEFSFDKKFPILLPKNHHLTILIMTHYHHNLLHCGPQQLLACVREMYWPISGKNTAKAIIRQCIKCFKVHPISHNPLMADLPAKRLQFNTPVFHNTGLDYAGPIMIKDKKTRGAKLIKAYICLFICLVTRAVHLELVTDLSTNAFMAVLKRFIARRGKPFTLSSDNGKNFVGANNQIKELYTFLQSKNTQKDISNFVTEQGFRWEFITPRAPHQGGIWESNIKSTKLHLKKVLGNTSLTFEDFYTVLVQVEAVLNSRPLSSISSDPTDFTPLTPGHLLIGKSLTSLPEPVLLDVSEQRLQLHQRIQRIVQHFWKRWSVEVVPDLQKRTKWFHHLPELLQQDSLVLLREDNTPPLTWMMGRVLQLHRAPDGVVRSVTLRTSTGSVTKRPVHKLCVLPV